MSTKPKSEKKTKRSPAEKTSSAPEGAKPKLKADPETINNLVAFVAEFAKESDRACVILGAARLDILLKQLVLRVLLPCTSSSDELLDGDSPLATFSSRIQISFRLGLIDAEFARALHLIRRIRNEFAHEASSVTLAQASHRDRIKQLVAPLKDTKIFQNFLEHEPMKTAQGSAREFRAMLALLCARLEGAVARARTLEATQCTVLVPKKWKAMSEDASSPAGAA